MYKVRYYANTPLFDATRGGGVSFIWSGLWETKEVLRTSFKWVVGDREIIRAFENPWVCGRENFMVNSVHADHNRGIKVCDLFLPDSKQWYVQKVYNLFVDYDVNSILVVPIPKNQVLDHMAWAHASDGRYTVKSVYHYWHTHFSDCKHVVAHRGWSALWNLKVLHKVSVFPMKIR